MTLKANFFFFFFGSSAHLMVCKLEGGHMVSWLSLVTFFLLS